MTDLNQQNAELQWNWLQKSLNNSNKFDWNFIVGHHPLYVYRNHSDSELRENFPEFIAKMNPILKKHQIQAVFNGHAHRMMLMKDNVTETEHYVSGAGGGTTIEPDYIHPFEKERIVEPGFMYVTVYRRQMEVQMINEKGILKHKHVLNNFKK
jgi:hypothetical protein